MSEGRHRPAAAKRALAATPSPARASRGRRRTRRRIGSVLDDDGSSANADDATAAVVAGAVTGAVAAAAAAVAAAAAAAGAGAGAGAASGGPEPESEEVAADQQSTSSSSEDKRSVSAACSWSSSKASSPARLAGARSPDVDSFSVISGDASPHGSVFDFLSFAHADSAPFSLLTPSPGFAKSSAASSPLSRRSASALSSPSRFFRSPCTSTAAKKKNSQARSQRARRLGRAADSEEKEELEAARTSISSSSGSTGGDSTAADEEEELHVKEEIVTEDVLRTPTRTVRAVVKEEIPQLMDMLSLSGTETSPFSPWPRAALFAATPSPPSRIQFLSRRLKDDFDREHGDDDASDNDGSVGTDELYRSAPSGLAGTSGEPDSFFSFANALSPLVHGEEFETSFPSVRLSPLVSLDTIPPFPMPRLDDETSTSSLNRETTTPGKAAATPKTPLFRRATMSGYSSGSSHSSASSILSESFPNIQASTSATPGKSERSKIGTHSIMKMKLHVSMEQSTLSHSKRDIEAINNSLRKKGRKRKLDEKRGLFGDVAPVQRKLLQTPLKASPFQSPHRSWSGRAHRQEVSFRLDSTPRRQGSSGSYSVLSTSTPSSSCASRQALGASSPAASALVMTPSSSWKKSRSVPPSGLTPGGFGGTSTPQPSSRLRRTPLRHAASIASVLTVVPGTPTGSFKEQIAETPPKAAALPAQAPHAVVSGLAVPPTEDIGMSTPAPIDRAAADGSSLAAATKPAVPKKAPCNCKKSKCLKLYCECFASGGYCDKNCNCQGCSNTPATEVVRQQAIAARLEKNPNAFKPKIEATVALTPVGLRGVRGTPGSGAHSFQTPVAHGRAGVGARASAGDMKKMHKHGCHCKKSACQKKYCECFQAGVPCGDNCRCIDCKNQAPCASHASSGTLSANVTPSRLLNDVDDTFVSPVLRNVRHRTRIDRETWAKNFSSPLEVSPRRERERNEQFRSHLRASTTMLSSAARGTPGAGGQLGYRAKTAASPSLSSAFMTPTASGHKRQKLSVSPVPEGTPAAAKESDKSQMLFMATPGGKHVISQQRARCSPSSTTTMARAAASGDRVLLFPLFGNELPPVKSAVSANIFHCLTNSDLYNASLVSKLWSQVALGDSVWDHANFVRAPACDSEETAADIVGAKV